MPSSDRSEETRRVEFRAEASEDGRVLEGYAAVFNSWTDITDHMGSYRERIAPGAFKRSIGQRQPVLQFDHGTHPLIGSLPLGSITTVREDRKGLFVRARLSDNWLIDPVRDAIRDGAIDGMSFRFRVIDDDWSPDNEERTIREVELLELGPVVFPAYAQTSVAVRSLVDHLDDDTRAELARTLGTSVTATEPAISDSPADEPPVASRTGTSVTAATEPASGDGPADEPPVASRINPIHALISERHPFGRAFLQGEHDAA